MSPEEDPGLLAPGPLRRAPDLARGGDQRLPARRRSRACRTNEKRIGVVGPTAVGPVGAPFATLLMSYYPVRLGNAQGFRRPAGSADKANFWVFPKNPNCGSLNLTEENEAAGPVTLGTVGLWNPESRDYRGQAGDR